MSLTDSDRDDMNSGSSENSPVRPSAIATGPVTVYTPEVAKTNLGSALSEFCRDIAAGRELAWRLFVRDLSAQYRQTYLGYVWAFLPPLVASFTFVFLNSQGITNIQTSGISYAAFALMGTLLWQTFVDSIQSPLQSISSAKPMLAKINFPREAILVGGLYMVVFNTLIRLLLLGLIMAWWGVMPGSGVALFPIAMIMISVAGFAIGLLIAPLGVLYNDVARSVPLVAGFWMLLTPVVYPPRDEGLLGILSVWNPISPLITTAREALTGDAFTHLSSFIAVSVMAVAACIVGLSIFRIIMPRLIERMGG